MSNPNIIKRRTMSQMQIAERQKRIARHFSNHAKRNFIASPYYGLADFGDTEDNYQPWWCDGCLEQVDYVAVYELDNDTGWESEIFKFNLCRECALENWDYIRDFD